MMHSLLKKWTFRQKTVAAIVLTAVIEIVTVILRFGLKLESHKHGSFLAPITFGLRIHHGFVGIAMIIAAFFFGKASVWRSIFLIVGFALAASDTIHHFLVLWPITGGPEFYLHY